MVRVAAAEQLTELEAFARQVAGCTRCRLSEGRTQVVFGVGNPDADLMFVGEGPGFHEDKQGIPFVGQAGKLLDKLLGGIGLNRNDVYIANIVKCRPPGNRDPVPDEKEACEPYLFRQIELIQPKVIASLGNHATKQLSGKDVGITRVHGKEQPIQLGSRSVLLYPLYHPAAALYTPAMLGVLEEDFARLPELIGRPEPATRARVRRGARRSPRPSPLRSARPLLTALYELRSASPAETEAAAATLAPALEAGDVVTVSGDLGSGKTTFVRGACRALGVTAPVTSPTFTIGHRYLTTPDVSHLDLFRFEGVSAAEWGDLEPYFQDAICFVEWPEAAAGALPPVRVEVRLSHVDPTHRLISLVSPEKSLLEGLFGDADARV